MATTITGEDYQLFIGGKWVDGSAGTYPVINPATEEVVADAPESSVDDAEAAAAAARDAQPAWSRTTPEERAALLKATADRLREQAAHLLPLIMAETGATVLVGSALQIPQAVSRFERYAMGALQDLDIALAPAPMETTPLAPGGLIGAHAIRQPVGVVTCISPYNFPLVNMAGKIAPALATAPPSSTRPTST
jgi:phenylacetaldehyde dehydrogenase